MDIESKDVLAKHLDQQRETVDAWFERRFDERFAAKLSERGAKKVASLSIIVSKGTLDWAYPPFIIASTAGALGWKVSMFFTFYGLRLLKKHLDLEISPLGNPAMPMKMPFGPEWLRHVDWRIPNLVMAGIPGFEKLATVMMKKTIREKGVAPIEDLRQACIEADVKLIACQMALDLFGWSRGEFIPEISEWAGAVSYLAIARDTDMNLFV